MGLRKDLKKALVLIGELQKENQELREENNELKRRLAAYDNPHTPSSQQRKKNTQRDEGKPRFPGKPVGSKGGGVKVPEPDEVVEHKLDVCPLSGLPLGLPVGFRRKIIIDVPDKVIMVVEHRIMRYVSPLTGEIVEPVVDLPAGIYGKNLQSLVVMLKNMVNSHEKIADLIRELGAPSFSSAEVQKIGDSFADKLEVEQHGFLQELKKESYVHADETGFRKDGQNGFVWGVFTKTIAVFRATMSRARENITNLLEGFKGVIVTDGYKAYDEFPLRQRCWAHLLRTAKDTAQDNQEIEVQYQRLKKLYTWLKELKEKPPDEKSISKAKWMLKDIVTCLKTIRGAKELATLIENGNDDWLTALYHPGVPLENNHAERELRHLVLLRKSIGCYRNEKGQRWINIVMSTIHTWKLQNKNIYKQLTLYAT